MIVIDELCNLLHFERVKIKYSSNIEYLKTIAIIMVIIYHCNSLLFGHSIFKTILMCICSSCVPIFFIINGYLTVTPEEINIKKLLQKVLNLFFLIIIWSVILVVSTSIIRGDTLSFKWIFNKILNNAIGYCNWIWFLNTLFVLFLLRPIFQKILNTPILYIYTWMVIGFFSIGIPTIDNIISLFSNRIELLYLSKNFNPLYAWPSFSIFYYMTGVFLKKPDIIKTKFLMIFMLVSLIFSFIISILTIQKYYDPVWDGYNTLGTVILSFGICTIILHKWKLGIPYIIKIIGKNTLGIYLIEAIVITYLKEIIKPISSIPIFIGIVILVLTLSTLITVIMRKIPYVKKLFII